MVGIGSDGWPMSKGGGPPPEEVLLFGAADVVTETDGMGIAASPVSCC